MSILYTITEKTSIEYLQLIEYFSTNLLHFEKRCDIMIASKGKPDAFSGKRSEKRDRTHKIFYFRDSMSRTRAVRQFRSGECAPQGVAMPCGKGGTMRLCRFGTPFESDSFRAQPGTACAPQRGLHRSERSDRKKVRRCLPEASSEVGYFRPDSAEGEQDSERLGLRGEPVRSVRLGGSRFCESVGAV